MQTALYWFAPPAMQDAFALFAGSLVPSCRKLALVLGDGCERLCESLFRNLCETVAYGACAVLWGMFVRGCVHRDLC